MEMCGPELDVDVDPERVGARLGDRQRIEPEKGRPDADGERSVGRRRQADRDDRGDENQRRTERPREPGSKGHVPRKAKVMPERDSVMMRIY